MWSCLRLYGGLVLGIVVPDPLAADWRSATGVTRLHATFADVPTAAGVLTQAEAGNAAGDHYLPSPTHPAFAGKTILNLSPGSGTSTHATEVGDNFFGTTDSLLPTTASIRAYNASYWLEADFLRFNSTDEPQVEISRVQNHSWIALGASVTAGIVADVNQRLDHAIHRDGFVSVAGVNNGQSTSLPPLLAQAYNHITVGLSTGMHSAGFTAFDGAGRIKPDLVAPELLTSFATPRVASAAGVIAAKASLPPHALGGAELPPGGQGTAVGGCDQGGISRLGADCDPPAGPAFRGRGAECITRLSPARKRAVRACRQQWGARPRLGIRQIECRTAPGGHARVFF